MNDYLIDDSSNRGLFERARVRLSESIGRLREPVGPPLVDVGFSDSEIASYFNVTRNASVSVLDDQTWNDLELQKYLNHISGGVSIFGRQALHRRLRIGGEVFQSQQKLENSRKLSELSIIDANSTETIKKLRLCDHDVSDLLFAKKMGNMPSWLRYTWILPLAMIMSIILLKASSLALLGLASSLVVSVWVQIRLFQKLQSWHRERGVLLTMLKTAKYWAELARRKDISRLTLFDENSDLINRLIIGLNPALFDRSPSIAEYTNLLWLSEYRKYAVDAVFVDHEKTNLQKVYSLVSELEGELAIGRHLMSTNGYCWLDNNSGEEIVLANFQNPLITDAIPLTIELKNNLFVSGQNGVGKSTFLRSLGINVVVANAFGYCYAENAKVPPTLVCSSIQIIDSTESAESLYMAEMRRANELLASCRLNSRTLCLVDEIFRGTNHLESVSAAASVLYELCQHSLVVVTSHNLILASLLRNNFAPICIKRAPNSTNGLLIENGILTETNGITLMNSYNFSTPIIRRAEQVFIWLEKYMSYPLVCPMVCENGLSEITNLND